MSLCVSFVLVEQEYLLAKITRMWRTGTGSLSSPRWVQQATQWNFLHWNMDLADKEFSRLWPELFGSTLSAGNPKWFFEHSFMCCLCVIAVKTGKESVKMRFQFMNHILMLLFRQSANIFSNSKRRKIKSHWISLYCMQQSPRH